MFCYLTEMLNIMKSEVTRCNPNCTHLNGVCDASEHALHICFGVCSQGCWRALLLHHEYLVLEQGEGDSEEKLHLALVVALL